MIVLKMLGELAGIYLASRALWDLYYRRRPPQRRLMRHPGRPRRRSDR